MPDTWEERTSLYCTYLAEYTQVQSSTLKSYVSAIKAKLTADDYKWDHELVCLSSLTRACKLKNDCIKVRLPIRKSLLECVLFETERKFGIKLQQKYIEQLYKTAFALGYYGLFRVGELTFSQHVIKAKDVHSSDRDKFLIVLHSSKTHSRADPPQKIKIQKDDWPKVTDNKINFSPTEEIKNFIKIRSRYNNDDDPFLVFQDGTPLTPTDLRSTLRELLQDIGLDAELYDTHSFRIGRATDLYKHNISVENIKKIGRWRSNAVYKYLRE